MREYPINEHVLHYVNETILQQGGVRVVYFLKKLVKIWNFFQALHLGFEFPPLFIFAKGTLYSFWLCIKCNLPTNPGQKLLRMLMGKARKPS